MKKILSVFICLLLGVGLLSGCSTGGDYHHKSYNEDGSKVKAVHINVLDRSIAVSPSDDDQIHIDYYESEKEFYNVSLSEDQVLTMSYEDNKDWKDYIGGKTSDANRKISIQIPESLLSSLVLSTTNEDISLPAIDVSDTISITSNGGNITFEKLNVGNTLYLEAKNGNISGTVIGGYDDFSITCETKKGESNLPSHTEGGKKSLQVKNNNGDINIQFVKG